ncbi:phytoene desaturase family protein [Fructobacillus parabroussonetiae]|uniref:Phytoene desaturase n=1 Tax=Fructobacillus parabroussonetiae TaxID=2713174 RepID=A0ABS5QXI6_9LACO|nr:phytoene desaturase family protein [Fructobacillus parabroussonetiae]MBS9337517.1 phytoene desaturase [Fructobacillus parabroussonetiae]
MKKVSIIGAGVGGLTTAIYLQKAGFDVTIYEKNDHPGGKMDLIEDSGFKFDTGPTIVMMPDVYEQPFKDTGVDYRDYFTMERVNPFMDVLTEGNKFELSSDLVDIARDFEAYGDGEMLGFLKYLTDIYGKYINAKNNFIYKSFRGPGDFYNLKTLWQAMRLRTFSTSFKAISKNIKNTNLQYLMSFQTLYIGISPFNGPSIYNIIPMIELIYGIWFIKGGMYEYAKAMAKRFEELGGQIRYESPVDEIVVKNDKTVAGLRIGQGFESADAVVANADFPYAMESLLGLPDQKKGKYGKAKVEKMDYAMSCFMLYLGIDRQYADLKLHTIKMAKDFEQNVHEIDTGTLPEDPSFYVYNPSSLDNSFAPSGQTSLYVLVPVANLKENDNWSDQMIEDYSEKVIEKVEKDLALTDLSQHIVVKHVFTPKTFASRYNSLYGTAFGLKPTLMQSNYFRPHNKDSRLKNLYFAGASVHPGAGVPIVITSGELAAKEVMRDFK